MFKPFREVLTILDKRPPYSHSVQVENLHVCNISYLEDGTPDSVSICGFIVNREPGTIAELGILLFQLPRENFISEVPPGNDSLFDVGTFSRDLNLNGTTGHYLVKIYLGREVIGSHEFYISK